MRSFPGNPYDGHTLRETLVQVEVLTDQRPNLAVVDRGYRGHDEDKTRVLISGSRRGMTPKLIADLRRRSAIEAEIGHMKTDGRLSRCPLKGAIGDALFGGQAALTDLKRSTKLFMDETRAPVLDSGARKTKTGYFRALARDDGPWGGTSPPGVVFTYAPGRGG